MNASPTDPERVSSPLATGGAGTAFEQHVDATILALLLVRGIPPVLLGCQILEVSFQAEHLGWATDDLLITASDAGGGDRRLAGQVKRSFTVSRKDEECQKAISDFWTDFQPGSPFRRDRDAFALFVLRGTNTLLGGLGELLECARASRDAADFSHRLATPGMLNKTAIEHAHEVRAIITKDGSPISDQEFWEFLKALHVISYDLNNATRGTESQIKSLLAISVHSGNPAVVAESTWNELLGLVDQAMLQARTFRWEDLPVAMRARHAAAPDLSARVLQKLAEHSAPVIAGTTSTIAGAVELPRAELTQHVMQAVLGFSITVVTGPSGSGKSALAKAVFSQLTSDRCGFAFRAEEFTAPHLDSVLHGAQIGVNASQLQAILAGQSENVLLIESVERLLEASTRHAFFDLLNTLPRDGSWRLILTCRDYSLDVVRSSFLAQLGTPHQVIAVPPLTDDELHEVIAAVPALARAADVPGLRRLLRNPYFLDKAARMDWSETRPLPTDERAFRDKFWAEIIRRDDLREDALPRRREDAFRALCLRRARCLSVYARCDDLDTQALAKLNEDGLIVHPKASDALAAPAHDVLEDWALIRWIAERAAVLEAVPSAIATDLGTFPAVRRAYRKWLVEWLECEPSAADRYIISVLTDASLPNYFRDDTLTAILTSTQSAAFLDRSSSLLTDNDAALLRRVIHLLRVACMAPPAWLQGADIGHQYLVPDGPAWAAALVVVRHALDRLLPRYSGLLLGLIDDWSRTVTRWNPYPPGSDDAAAIATALLPHFDDYNTEEQRKLVLGVLAKIPKSDATTVADLLQRGTAGDRHDRAAEDFAEVVLNALGGVAVARDFPDELIALAMARLKLREEDDECGYRGFSGLDLEPIFGLEEHSHFGSFPASAFQGPFLPLLQNHPSKGMRFIVDLMNHCCDAYAANTAAGQTIEPPFSIDVIFPDGTHTTQHANGRLWNLYRGTTVGPYVLQSALMALERFLLEFATVAPQNIDSVLTSLLRITNNVAVSAVVASVVTAHPRAAPETSVILLGCREFILLDRMRFATEAQAPSHMLAAFASIRSHDRHHDDERKASDALAHRRLDLETVAPNLQLTEHGPRIYDLLDAHHARLPPLEQQTDEDRIWRLALRRMDIRKYEIDDSQKPSPAADEPAEADAPAKPADDTNTRAGQIPLRLSAPEQDIQDMIDRGSDANNAFNTAIELMNWGFAIYERDGEKQARPEQWREFLAKARTATEAGILKNRDTLPKLSCGGPAFIAAVCVRDYWNELDQGDRDWCIDQLEGSLLADAETTDEASRVSRVSMDAAIPAATVTPILLTKTLPEPAARRVENMLAVAMTHAVSNVVRHAAAAVGREQARLAPSIVHRCAAAIVEQAKRERALRERLQRWNPEHGPEIDREELAIAREARELVRGNRTYEGNPFADIDVANWRECWALYDLVPLLLHCPESDVARQFFRRISETVAHWWGTSRRRDRSEADRPFELERYCMEGLSLFVLRLTNDQAITICEPMLAQVNAEPRGVATFLSDLISKEDRFPNPEVFWAVWGAFAEAATHATWLSQTDRERSYGEELIDNLFLGHYWKDGVTHWSTLDQHVQKVHELVRNLPATAVVVEGYTRFLHKVGRQSLPQAFAVLADRLRAGNASAILQRSNTRFLLEAILRPYVYATPHEAKANPQLRDAILFILDSLIDAGSSAAYRMREDFLTPIPPPDASHSA